MIITYYNYYFSSLVNFSFITNCTSLKIRPCVASCLWWRDWVNTTKRRISFSFFFLLKVKEMMSQFVLGKFIVNTWLLHWFMLWKYIQITMELLLCKKERIWAELIYEMHTISFQTFFVWALLLIVHTWNSCPLRSNLLQLQCTCCTVPTTSGRPHRSPLVWACQWPSSQPLSSPQLSHNDSLWA